MTKDLCNETRRSLADAQQEAVVPELVDHTGRGIPLPEIVKSAVVHANRDFYHEQSTINFARLKEYFPSSAKFPREAEFVERTQAAIEKIRADRQVGNLLAGPYFVGCFPQMNFNDLGTLIDRELIPVFERSYNAQFPDRKFNSYRKGQLAEKVMVAPGTRHERFIEALWRGPVIYIYRPALQGFSIPASREFVRATPEWVLLSGIDVLGVGIAYPEVIGRDWKTPGLDLAALQWKSNYSLYFKASGGELRFDCGVVGAGSDCAGGLVVLG